MSDKLTPKQVAELEEFASTWEGFAKVRPLFVELRRLTAANEKYKKAKRST